VGPIAGELDALNVNYVTLLDILPRGLLSGRIDRRTRPNLRHRFVRQGMARHLAWLTVEGCDMTDAFIIETQGRTAGIAVRDVNDYQFYASDHLFSTLESRRFRTLRVLHAAVDEQIKAQESRRQRRDTRNTLLRRQQIETIGS
jgi:hypothetical protein